MNLCALMVGGPELELNGVAISFLSFLLVVNNFVSKLATFYSLVLVIIMRAVVLMCFLKAMVFLLIIKC